MTVLSSPLRDALTLYSSQLRGRFGDRLRWVRLFGSYARGQATEHSDVDVAVVIDGLSWKEREEAIDCAVDVELATQLTLSPFVVSGERFDELLSPGTQNCSRHHGGGNCSVTDDNVRLNVSDEFKLAATALKAADALFGLNLLPDAASRAYYAAFHAARALLFSAGLEPRSHQAVRSLLSRHFVKEGLLSPEQSKHLAHLEAIRSASDSDSTFA